MAPGTHPRTALGQRTPRLHARSLVAEEDPGLEHPTSAPNAASSLVSPPPVLKGLAPPQVAACNLCFCARAAAVCIQTMVKKVHQRSNFGALAASSISLSLAATSSASLISIWPRRVRMMQHQGRRSVRGAFPNGFRTGWSGTSHLHASSLSKSAWQDRSKILKEPAT